MKCKRNSLASTLGVLFCAGALALASGCIRRSEYDALKADMDALRVDLTDQIGARDGELKLRKGELDDLNSTLRAEEAKADALDTRKSELEVELQSARTRADARSARHRGGSEP